MPSQATRLDEDHTDKDLEREALLSSEERALPTLENPSHLNSRTRPRRFGFAHLFLAFTAGSLACLLGQYAACGGLCFSKSDPSSSLSVNANLAPPWVGSTEVHPFPPSKPTNADPSLFPSRVGYAGATPTGAEPALVATAPAYPINKGTPNLITPGHFASSTQDTTSSKFNLFRSWGNLSPWYSVDKTSFGLDTSPEAPESCAITGLHLLHRHGARYPTAWGAWPDPRTGHASH